MNKRIVITGVGVLASNGIGKDAFWDALEKGRSGIKEVSLFETSPGAEVASWGRVGRGLISAAP